VKVTADFLPLNSHPKKEKCAFMMAVKNEGCPDNRFFQALIASKAKRTGMIHMISEILRFFQSMIRLFLKLR
jgi:hypothetical protein